MSKYVSKPIPFQTINGRQALSEEQLYNDPSLMDFVKKFKHLFHSDPLVNFYFYYPEGVPEHLTAKVRSAFDFTKEIDLTADKSDTKSE